MKRLAVILLSFAAVACAPVQVLVDNPKDGSTIQLAAEQPLRLRLTNVSQGAAWVMESQPTGAVAYVGHEAKPPAGGALGLQFYDFKGAKAGEEQITFARRADGAEPSPADETFTVTVAVN